MQKSTPFKKLLKSEAVLIISACAAILSMIFVPPSLHYIEYIDFRTLSLLFCLMAAISGLRSAGLFDTLASRLTHKFQDARSLTVILILLCFFSSMFITNDVALITFVPFTIIIFTTSDLMNRLIYTIVLETVAANLGSMLTPFGNPQNLYLYTCYHINPLEFFRITVPVTLTGLLILCAAAYLCKKHPLHSYTSKDRLNHKKFIFYLLLFILCLFSVFYIIDYRILIIISSLLIIIMDRKLFKTLDFGLLLTFVFFFIFVGNLERIESVKLLLETIIRKHEIIYGILFSQIISNVPAAVLLSGFTDNYKSLIIGTNIGGLGTIVASLASLISFKLYVKTKDARPLKYLGVFTLVNLIFLIPLFVLSLYL